MAHVRDLFPASKQAAEQRLQKRVDAKKQAPLYAWKFLSHLDGFVAVVVATTKVEAESFLLARILKDFESNWEELEKRSADLKSLLSVCEVSQMPVDRAGFICLSGL